MRTDRCLHITVAALFLAVIAAPGLIQTVAELGRGERPGALDVFDEPPTAANLRAYERRLERTSLVVKQLRPWAQFLEWRFLGDAGEKAVVGRDGWLFYGPSVQYQTDRPTGAVEGASGDPVAAIRSFRDQLEERGIRLLVVPVPNKESVYPEMLARRAERAGVVVCAQTRRLLDQLGAYGIEYVDLFEVFRRARQAPGGLSATRFYLTQDSHWSPEGARVAAGVVVKQVLDGGVVNRGDRAYRERSITVRRHGDLVAMLQVPEIERSLEPETLTCLQVVESGASTPYRDSPESEILMMGDSFLRIYEQDEPGAAGFVAHVARGLGQPVTSIVNDGGASTLVRQALARRPTLLVNKKLVIWEFTERDIRYGVEGWKIVALSRSKGTPR